MLAVVVGWLIAHDQIKGVAAVLIGVPVLALAFTARASAPLAAILVLGVMNGIPVVNLGGRLPGGLRIQDFAVIALAVLLFAYRDRSEVAQAAPYGRALRVWSWCFVGWWAITLARTVLIDGEPFRFAFLDGRDFLYFSILVPLALRARFPTESLRIGAVILLGGVAVYAIAQTFAGLVGVAPSVIIHPTHVAAVFGQARLYSPMNYVVDSCLIFATALLWSRGSPGQRRIVGGLVAVFAAGALLGLTRANYFGLGVALAACAIVYMLRHGSVTDVVVRVVVGLLVVVAAVMLFTAITGQSGSLTGNPIVARVSKGLNDFTKSTGTVGYRENIDSVMLQVLGTSWPVGLGFLHPGAHYVAILPSGTIRNADTGVFNGLMTMGVVGLLLIYAPLAYAVRELLRLSRSVGAAVQSMPPWILYAGVGWVAWTVASSVTLVVLFSVPGVVLSALALAVLGWAIRDLPPTPALEGPNTAAPVSAAVDGYHGRRRPRAGQPTRVAARARTFEPSRAPRRSQPTRLVARAPERSPQTMPAFEPSPTTAPATTNGASHPPVEARPVATQLSVVVVTYNSGHCIRGCIKALRTVLGACEVIVVDNLSADDTVPAVWSTDARVRVISKQRNAGYGSACNSGVRAATNEHVIVMNPDVRLEHADLDSLAATIAQPTFGLLAPGLRRADEPRAHPQTFARSTWLGELRTIALGPFRPRGLRRPSHIAETQGVAWASGALMVVRRSEFLALGGFDERFFLYYEDQDLGIRYRDAGLPIRGTGAVTGVHGGGQSVAAEGDQRVDAMAWCLLGWLEFVAMRYGTTRAKLSWQAIRASHRIGGRLAEEVGGVTRLKRLQRKAAQLRSVDAAVRQIARAGVSSDHASCPAACRLISDTSRAS